METLNNISVTDHLVAKTFDPNELHNHHLSLWLGRNQIGYSLTNELSKQVVYLKAFYIREAPTSWAYEQLLKGILDKETILKNNFNKIIIGIATVPQTLVPKSYTHRNNLQEFFQFNHGKEELEQSKIFTDSVYTSDIDNVYAIKNHLLEMLTDYFGEFSLQHSMSFVLKELLIENFSSFNKKVFINTESQHLDVYCFEKDRLLLCNTYPYKRPEDFLYFVLNAAQEVKFDFNNDELILLGDIEKRDKTYLLIEKYFANIKLSKQPTSKTYCEELEQLPSQLYHSLYSIY